MVNESLFNSFVLGNIEHNANNSNTICNSEVKTSENPYRKASSRGAYGHDPF